MGGRPGAGYPGVVAASVGGEALRALRLALKRRALRRLARRDHARAELSRLLARSVAGGARDDGDVEVAPSGGIAVTAEELAQCIAAVLDELAAAGLLSDQRAAESLVAARGARLGPRRLQQALQARGIGAEVASAALRESRASEVELARELWRRRFGTVAADARERTRQARFLIGRGFSAELVQRLVSRAGEDPDAGS